MTRLGACACLLHALVQDESIPGLDLVLLPWREDPRSAVRGGCESGTDAWRSCDYELRTATHSGNLHRDHFLKTLSLLFFFLWALKCSGMGIYRETGTAGRCARALASARAGERCLISHWQSTKNDLDRPSETEHQHRCGRRNI